MAELELNALVIDDTHEVRILMQGLLSRYGVETTCKHNGRSGLDEYLKNPEQYDIVFTDLRMPDITGVQVIKGILQIMPQHKNIYAITGFASDDSHELTHLIGDDHLIAKPFRIERIRNIVNACATTKMACSMGLMGLEYIVSPDQMALMNPTKFNGHDSEVLVKRDGKSLVYNRMNDRSYVFRRSNSMDPSDIINLTEGQILQQ